jgi:hypothetical protein
MKNINVLILSCLVSLNAWAVQPLKHLNCQVPDVPAENFSATLDPNAYDIGSGYYKVVEASAQVQFAMTKLICEGYKPEAIRCVGFWNSTRTLLADISTELSPVDNKIHARIKPGSLVSAVDMVCEPLSEL